MNTYELTVILRNSDAEATREKVMGILQKYSVNVLLDEPWGLRKLAYQIENEKEGFYLFMNIEASPDSVQKITSDFRLNHDILRYLFIAIKQTKSA